MLEGVAKDWQARSVMTPANIKNMFGSITVNVRETDNELDMFFGDDTFGATRRKYMQIKDYIDLICDRDRLKSVRRISPMSISTCRRRGSIFIN